jgi:hypothetical protein
MAGLEHRDTVTDFEMPAVDIAVVHLPTTSTIDRLQELYPQGPFEARRFRPQHCRIDWQRGCALCGERLDRQHGPHRRHCSPSNHRTVPALRDDYAAARRPSQRFRNPPDGCSTKRSERRRLRLGYQRRDHPPRRRGRVCLLGLTCHPFPRSAISGFPERRGLPKISCPQKPSVKVP